MKRRLALFLAAALTVLTLTACGGSGGGATMAASGGDESAPADYQENKAASWGFDAAGDEALTETEAEERLANAKMVYTANIEAETTDFDACSTGLEALVTELGGYMEYASVGSRSDGTRNGNYTARIPSARFEDFLRGVGEIGHIINQNRNAENISERYYDTESRLVTQRTKLERLQALLSKAENMEDIITLEGAIAETELQIEQLTGSLRHYDALVDYATIEVRLQEVLRLSTVEEAPPTFGSRLGNAFVDGIHEFGDFLQDVAIFLAYNWTWLALLALIAGAIVGVSKRKSARGAEGSQRPKTPGTGFFRRREKDEPKKPDDKQPED